MPSILVSAPTSYPVTLSEAKAHLRETENDNDIIINDLIKSATEVVEKYTNRRLITQTWDLFLNEFSQIEIPYGKLQSITTVKYYDTDNAQQTLSTSVYQVDTNSDPGNIALAYGQSWPSIYERLNPIEIRFICGYGIAPQVPQAIKQAIKLSIELQYGNLFDSEIKAIESAYYSLLNPYRVATL